MDYNITYREKDKSIQCIISYKDEYGKWKQKSKQGFKTQKAAKPWIKTTVEELEEQIKLNKLVDPSLKGITFKELMEKYIEHKKLHREFGTIKLIEYAWKKFESLDDILAPDITNLDTQSCVDRMVKEGLAYNTFTNYIGLIKAAFYYAMKNKIIKENPLNDMTIPEDKSEDKVKALNKWELDNLISKIDNPIYKLVTLIAGTCGLRRGEIVGLTWDDIDIKNATLHVKKQWKPLDDNKSGMGKVKRKNSIRSVPIPPDTIKLLEKYKMLYPIHTSKRIFYTRTSSHNLGRELSLLYKKLGYDISVHNLRHTYATILLSKGVDAKTVAEFLGDDVNTVMKTYSHVIDDMRNRAREIINQVF